MFTARRGLTFLEIIFAVALLGLVAGSSLSIIGIAQKAQVRQQRVLGAAEVANRLILMFLDDPDTMPSELTPIAYNTDKFHYKLSQEPVKITEAVPAAAGGNSSSGQPSSSSSAPGTSNQMSLDRLQVLRVRVWLSEDSGGSMSPAEGVPEATLTRLVDPFASLTRNPDSFNNLMSSPEGMRNLRNLLGGNGSSGGRSGGSGKSSSSASGSGK